MTWGMLIKGELAREACVALASSGGETDYVKKTRQTFNAEVTGVVDKALCLATPDVLPSAVVNPVGKTLELGFQKPPKPADCRSHRPIRMP